MLAMNARRADLGFRRAGNRVEVEISGPATVRLMEPEDLMVEQLGGPTLCPGGTYSAGRVVLEVPEDAHWLHVVDVVGLGGPVSISAARVVR